MNETILITSPSLDKNKNVGGVSAVTEFLINSNKQYQYKHFELGRYDGEKRGIIWFSRILKAWISWFFIILFDRKKMIHFNLALEKPSVFRDLPLIFFAKMLRRKMLIHLHGGRYLTQQPPEWISFLLTMLLSGKTKIIALSPVEEKLIRRKYRANNVIVLPNSIDISEAKAYKRDNYSQNPVNLLFIGRIVKDKGLDDIFTALQDLSLTNVPFNFHMAGSGPQKDEYVDKFSRKLGSRFHYEGVVKGNSKTELFKKSHIFLLPSFYEGLPISLLECMAFGLVPVVTDVGSVQYAVTDAENGIFVGVNKPDDILNAVEKLAGDRALLKQMGTRARQTVYNKFNPEMYLDNINKIYKEVLSEHSST